MRVVCDNCGASYKIPDSKLTKEVNKATCRKCGHAIFIRRAGEDAPPTVASQPTPSVEERTLITSAADLERAVRSRASGTFEEADQRPTTVSLDSGNGEATVPRAPAPMPASVAPAPPPPMPSAPRQEARAPAHAFAPPPPAPQASRSPLISPSAAPRVSAAPQDPPPHSPRTDLTMALASLLATLLGVLVLAVGAALGNPLVAGLGVFLALLGILIVAFIILTSRMGSQPANLLVSLSAALLLSGLLGAGSTGALYGLTLQAPVASLSPPVAAIAPPVAPVAPIAEPVTPSLADVAAPVVPEPTAPTAPTPVASAPVAPPVATAPTSTPAPASTPTTTRAPASSTPTTSSRSTASTGSSARTSTTPPSSPRTSTRTTEEEEPKARITPTSTTSSSTSSRSSTPKSPPSEATTPAASKSSGVSAVVVDTMIKSNKGVKTCFINQRSETGELPKGVKVKMTIQSSGKVSSASVPSGDWQGTPFDSCVSGAVKAIQFPPFEGDAVSLTYPFAI